MKHLTAFSLIIIFLLICICFLHKNKFHKVLKVVSANEFYIDFNDNKTADDDELVVLDNIDTEPLLLNKIETVRLNYLAKKYAEKILLNQNVIFISSTDSDYAAGLLTFTRLRTSLQIFIQKFFHFVYRLHTGHSLAPSPAQKTFPDLLTARYGHSICSRRFSKNDAQSIYSAECVKLLQTSSLSNKLILEDNSDYKTLVEKNGYILTKTNIKQVKENIAKSKKLNLVVYNKNTNKYHKLDCKYALESPVIEIVEFSNLDKKAVPCKLCILNKSKEINNKTPNKFPKDVYEKYSPVYKDGSLEFYITDYTKYYYPSQKCLTTACMSLVKEINNAKNTIDFAIYGIDKQPVVVNALLTAQKRGVKIRWVYDTDKRGTTIYSDSLKLKKYLTNTVTDSSAAGTILSDGRKMRDSIMHNKFFIFDKQKVWTGSANISHTDLSGFNANSALLINSKAIASLYEQEFEQMYSGKFHLMKTATPKNLNTVSNSLISVYFSPQDDIINRHILPLIDNAKKYIYVPVFVVTHKDFYNALVDAKNRGVDVRLIVDATSAASRYSSVRFLRQNGVKVKTENRAGKMHMKSIIIDDEYIVTGSMNFTKSGERYNDENVLIIKNPKLAAKFKNKFLYFYNDIPQKWLYKNPGAESINSINSCYDGIDNDFDGNIDKFDSGCIKKY